MANVFKRFLKGILLVGETSDPSDNKEGSIFHNFSESRLKTYIGGAVREVITNSQGQSLTNKTIIVSSNSILTAASGNLSSTELNAALAELQSDIDSRATSASNVGTGSGVFKQKSGSTLELKSLSAGSNITITEVGDSLQLSASGTIGVNDATTSVKGIVKLAGDLGGTADLPTVPALSSKAPLASPALTGTPTAPTAPAGTNTTQIATTEFVSSAANSVFKAGDSKLSYADPGTNWTLANGGTLYKNENTELYSLFGTELSSAIQTINPSDLTANASNKLHWLSDTFALIAATGGDSGATNTGNLYTAVYNPTARNLGSFTRVDATLGIPTIASDFKNVTCLLYPYIFIYGQASFNIFVLKFNEATSSLSLTQTINLGEAIKGNAYAFTTRGKDYLSVRTGATITLYERSSETWSASTTTVDSLLPITSPTGTAGAMIFWENWGLISLYDTPSAVYRSRFLKYNSITNSYNIHSVVDGFPDGTTAAGIFGGVGGSVSGVESQEIFTSTDILIPFSNGTSFAMRSLKYNSGTDTWSVTATIVNSIWGGSIGAAFYLRSSLFSPTSRSNSFYSYNSTDKILHFSIGNIISSSSFKVVSVQIVNGVAIAGADSTTIYTGTAPAFPLGAIPKDAGIGILNSNANSSAGQFLLCPLRKTLPNLASPSLGLNYYLKK